MSKPISAPKPKVEPERFPLSLVIKVGKRRNSLKPKALPITFCTGPKTAAPARLANPRVVSL